MMKKYSFVIIGFITLLQLNAQVITNYTTSEGLLDNFVECLDVDPQDNIWFGTSMGLQMFDGENWMTYTTTDYPNMVSDNIKVVRAMHNGDIWIGTDLGACRFDGVTWTTFDTSNGLNHNKVLSIDEAESGVIWIGTQTGISYYDGLECSSISSPHWSGVIVTIAESPDNIWFGSPVGGITFYDGVDYTSYDSSDGLLSNNTTDLLFDDDGNKWVGTGVGISVLDENNLIVSQFTQMYILPPPDTLNQIVDLDMDSEGRIWAGIYVDYLGVGGVAMWDGNDWIDYDESDGLVGPNIRGLAIDSFDNVWVATSTGVSKIGDQTNEMSDQDGDGMLDSEGDCDDTDASIYLGAPEIPNDGVDQDCDGSDFIFIPDCTNSEASNFNPSATVDDGSCVLLIVLRVDMFLNGGAASLVTELGTIPGEPISFGVYKFEILVPEGAFLYRYMDDNSIQELDERSIFISSPMSLDAVCFNNPGSCPGCTNPEFYEFNPYAASDTLMCQTAAAIGCTYNEALNFDSTANIDGGTCLFAEVSDDSCPGDLNLDGTVGSDDLLIFLMEWGTLCF